jgi:hypothetical protein
MNHPTIVTAFDNAATRNESKIYITFKRDGIFYKDTYLILQGNKQEVEEAIENLYYDVNEERYSGPRADHIDLLDTPFDTWCRGACILERCNEEQLIKCGSQWTHFEHSSEKEQLEYVKNIKPGYYPTYTVDYI